MKESRLTYKVKRPKTFKDFDGEREHHANSKSKMERRSQEVKNIDRAIRSKDIRALLEDID